MVDLRTLTMGKFDEFEEKEKEKIENQKKEERFLIG